MLIRKLAQRRTANTARPAVRYSESEKVSYVFEDAAWLISTQSREVTRTKKADLETGEDQKGQ